MAINLKGKVIFDGSFLRQLEQLHGYCTVDGVPTSRNDAACQVLIDAWDAVADYKAIKNAAIKAEGLSRIQNVLPGIDNYATLMLMRELWVSIAANARSPSQTMTYVINVYTAATNALTQVKDANTQAQVDAVTPAWPAPLVT